MTAPLPLIEGKCKCQQCLKEKSVPSQEQAVADEKKGFQAVFTTLRRRRGMLFILLIENWFPFSKTVDFQCISTD